ncbi:hypothetical protein D3C81_2061460 [compost metagenome]
MQMQALAIALGQGHGLQHAVHRRHLPGRTLAGQRQGDRPAAGTQVEHLGRCRRQQFKSGFHQ